jgi:hypothetical protein
MQYSGSCGPSVEKIQMQSSEAVFGSITKKYFSAHAAIVREPFVLQGWSIGQSRANFCSDKYFNSWIN